jgi:hypothetical protein
MVVGGGVDGNPMVTASLEEDHSNHINSYVENVVVPSFFCR